MDHSARNLLLLDAAVAVAPLLEAPCLPQDNWGADREPQPRGSCPWADSPGWVPGGPVPPHSLGGCTGPQGAACGHGSHVAVTRGPQCSCWGWSHLLPSGARERGQGGQARGQSRWGDGNWEVMPGDLDDCHAAQQCHVTPCSHPPPAHGTDGRQSTTPGRSRPTRCCTQAQTQQL